MKTNLSDASKELILTYKEMEIFLIKLKKQAEKMEKRLNILEQKEKDSK